MKKKKIFLGAYINYLNAQNINCKYTKIANPSAPVLIKSLETAGGAHHVAITPDESRAYVQNSLLNLPGINDGSITVIDLVKLEVIGTIDTFKDKGLAPNSITMLPKWYHPAGHFNNGLP